jgi:hypothetical protein
MVAAGGNAGCSNPAAANAAARKAAGAAGASTHPLSRRAS